MLEYQEKHVTKKECQGHEAEVWRLQLAGAHG